MSFPDILKGTLNAAIADTLENRGEFSSLTDFTRRRKLPLETVIRLLLSMSGGSLAKELYAAGVEATPSAFVFQRHKLSAGAMRNVMQNFNQNCHDDTLYRGKYRLLALDGTTVNLCPTPPPVRASYM